jgi:CDP-diacylglycerol---glycerol-3-phosphate 3-phosphatidyltransferase
MTLANKVSVFRFVLLLAVVYIIFELSVDYYVWALIFHLIGLVLDKVDGVVARKMNQTTKSGYFLDRIIDKSTQITMMVIFIFKLPILPAWLLYFVIIRDMLVDELHLLTMQIGLDHISNIYGKLKTLFLMLLLTTSLAYYCPDLSSLKSGLLIANNWLILLLVIASTVSTYLYIKTIVKSKKIQW